MCTEQELSSLFGIMIDAMGLPPSGLLAQEDMSLTRSNAYMLDLIKRAGMSVAYNVQQRNFPKELFQVRMYAVRPATATA